MRANLPSEKNKNSSINISNIHFYISQICHNKACEQYLTSTPQSLLTVGLIRNPCYKIASSCTTPRCVVAAGTKTAFESALAVKCYKEAKRWRFNPSPLEVYRKLSSGGLQPAIDGHLTEK